MYEVRMLTAVNGAAVDAVQVIMSVRSVLTYSTNVGTDELCRDWRYDEGL